MADVVKKVMMTAYDERLKQVQWPFLKGFFGKTTDEEVISDSEVVEVDVIRDNRRVAVDVIRGGGAGNLNTSGVYSTKEYKVPLYWEEAPITAAMLNKRPAGVNPYDPVDKAALLVRYGTDVQIEQTLKIVREIERMAGEALHDGKITLKNLDTIDFGQKATHKAAVSAAWNATGQPITDIRAMCETVFADGKRKPNTVIFGSAAWDAFINNTSVQEYLDKRWIQPGQIAPAEILPGATLQGRVWIGDYQLDLYTYSDFYIDQNGNQKTYIPSSSVIILDRTARLSMCWGAVEVLDEYRDEYDGMGFPQLPVFQPGTIVPFLYPKPPSTLMAGVQSAPLVVPTAIDTIGVLTNVA